MKTFEKCILPLSVLVLMACSQSVTLKVPFKSTDNVSSGTAVVLEGQKIGKVVAVKNSDAGNQVHLVLNPEAIKQLRSNAAAMVVESETDRHVELFNSATGELGVKDGDELLAIDSGLQLALWQAGEVIDATNSTTDELVGSLNDYLTSDQWQQRKQDMNKDFEDLKQTTEEGLATIGKELTDLLGNLDLESKDTGKVLAEGVGKIARELENKLKELNDKGKLGFADKLKDFLVELDAAMTKKQGTQSGDQKSDHTKPEKPI